MSTSANMESTQCKKTEPDRNTHEFCQFGYSLKIKTIEVRVFAIFLIWIILELGDSSILQLFLRI